MIFLLKHMHSDNKFRIDTYIFAVPMGKTKRENKKWGIHSAKNDTYLMDLIEIQIKI